MESAKPPGLIRRLYNWTVSWADHPAGTHALFWIAFIFTRPFGASFGDLLTKPLAKGGLDLGTLNASLASLALIAGMVWLETRRPARLVSARD